MRCAGPASTGRLIADRAARALRCEARLCAIVRTIASACAARRVASQGGGAGGSGLVVVPGSRGALSFLVAPRADAPAEALASIAHGAGRKIRPAPP